MKYEPVWEAVDEKKKAGDLNCFLFCIYDKRPGEAKKKSIGRTFISSYNLTGDEKNICKDTL